jgi:hypothetical protein
MLALLHIGTRHQLAATLSSIRKEAVPGDSNDTDDDSVVYVMTLVDMTKLGYD